MELDLPLGQGMSGRMYCAVYHGRSCCEGSVLECACQKLSANDPALKHPTAHLTFEQSLFYCMRMRLPALVERLCLSLTGLGYRTKKGYVRAPCPLGWPPCWLLAPLRLIQVYLTAA